MAKENEDGNLRMVFARPISRLRLLLVKYTAICLYTFSFVFFVEKMNSFVMASYRCCTMVKDLSARVKIFFKLR